MEFPAIDPKLLPAPTIPFPPWEDCQQQHQLLPSSSPSLHNSNNNIHQRTFQQQQQQPGATPLIPNLVLFQQPALNNTTAAPLGKRRTNSNSTDARSIQQQQHHHHHQHPRHRPASALQTVDLNQAQACSIITPQPVMVSTGLRLSFDDENSAVTSSQPDTASLAPPSPFNELSGQFFQQQQELNCLIKNQCEQLRHALEEQARVHSCRMLAVIEEDVSRRLHDRELELDRVNRRNMELQEQVRHLSMETHMWHSKATSNEAMVAVLRTNLQQAVAQSREQSRAEGCGDSEADDAASAHIDPKGEAQAARAPIMMMNVRREQGAEFVRVCRRCRAKEVSVLLLPCLHLCLCNDCKAEVNICPLCSSLKNASVEVYLS